MEILESKQYLDDCRNLYHDYKSRCSVQSLQSASPNVFYENLEREINNLNNLEPYRVIEKVESLVSDVESCYELRITYNTSCYVHAFNNVLFNKLKNVITEDVYNLLKTRTDVYTIIDNLAGILKDPLKDLETVIESIIQSQNYTEFKDYTVPGLAKYILLTDEDLVKSGDEIDKHLYPIRRLLELNRKLKSKLHDVYLNLVNERYTTLENKTRLYSQSIPLNKLNVVKPKTELVQFIRNLFEKYNTVNTRLINLIKRINTTSAKILTDEFRNLELEISPFINE